MSGLVDTLRHWRQGAPRVVHLAFEVVGEAEVVPEVELERGGGDVARVGEAVGLHRVGALLLQSQGVLEIAHRQLEEAQRDVAVPAMAEEPHLARMGFDARGVDGNRIAEAAEVGGAPPKPQDVVDLVRIVIEVALRFLQQPLVSRPGAVGERGRVERVAEQRIKSAARAGAEAGGGHGGTRGQCRK